jgi:catechol 2,3-dioxygenase-like lactoylglutathione lyase family enzyme
MTIQRMDNVGIVVDDLDAAVAFFTELGMELEGRMPIEGSWAGNVVGLHDMRSEIAMMRVPDAPGRLELAKYHTPKAITPKPEITPANTLGLHRVMFAVDDIEDTLARRRTRWRSDALRGQLPALLSPRAERNHPRAGRAAELRNTESALNGAVANLRERGLVETLAALGTFVIGR